MIIAGAGVPGISDIRDNFTLRHDATFLQPVGIVIEMGVVVDELFVCAHLVDGGAPGLALEEFDYLAAGGSQHRRPFGSHDVNGIVHASFTASGGKCIDQLVTAHAGNRND